MVLTTLLTNATDLDPTLLILPIIDKIQPILINLSLLVGGIFGLYLIMTLSKIYYDRKNSRLLQDIRFNLDQLNKHYGLRYSEHNRTTFEKIINSLKQSFHYTKAQQEFDLYNQPKPQQTKKTKRTKK